MTHTSFSVSHMTLYSLPSLMIFSIVCYPYIMRLHKSCKDTLSTMRQANIANSMNANDQFTDGVSDSTSLTICLMKGQINTHKVNILNIDMIVRTVI